MGRTYGAKAQAQSFRYEGGTMRRDGIGVIVAELGVFLISLLVFWLFISGVDAMGYTLFYVWGFMLLVSCVTSFIVGLRRIWNGRGVLWPVLCAVLITLLPWMTFDASYALHSGRLLIPDPMFLIGGCIVSYVAFGLGAGIRMVKTKIGR